MDAANVVVTGAAGALGRVVARQFLERGHPLVLVDRDLDALRAAYAGVGGDLRFVAVDLADAAATGAALGDALRGDAGLFTRDEAVEEAWRVVDPVLDLPTPVETYESGSWGPASARGMVAGEQWHDPGAEGSSPC